MKALVFSVVALLCAAGCTVNSTAAPTPTGPSTFSVSGTITLRSVSGWRTDYGVCYGLGGYSDIRQGAQVKVTDAAGKVVGLGDLGAGQQVGSLLEGCAFTFGVVGVPADGDIYGVEVTNRGIVQFKKADASGARHALVFGGDELDRGEVALKPLRLSNDGSAEQTTRTLADVATWATELRTA